nr:hypothetical protein [Bifidobacterium bifidum]
SKSKMDFNRYGIHECGMHAPRFLFLALHFKAVLKTGSEYWMCETKGFSCELKIYFDVLILTFQK